MAADFSLFPSAVDEGGVGRGRGAGSGVGGGEAMEVGEGAGSRNEKQVADHRPYRGVPGRA